MFDGKEKKINEILDRGIIVSILPSKEEFKKALTERKLKFYIGADPTAKALHLSHAKNYMLLEEFRQLGHEVIVLFGDFTATIGDPSDRDSTRKQLNKDEVRKNVEYWKKQISPLLGFDDDKNPAKVLYNSEWLAKMSFEDALSLAANFTVQQMIERDMFQKRLKNNEPIYLHEFLYPLMQGYDSVAMDVDVELCGTDQTFNALAGRTLLKRLKDKDKFVVAVNLMENPETGELMSKSKGTGVFLGTTAEEMFGAIMAQPDSMIKILFVNNTRVPLPEIDKILASENPKEQKMFVAKEITRIFYGEEESSFAQGSWENTFSKGNAPENIESIPLDGTITNTLVNSGFVGSKSEYRRLLLEGALSFEGEKITDINWQPKENGVLKIGKRRFVRIETN